MGVAESVAKRSKCDAAQIGCVIVDVNNRPIATGYNGPPKDFPTPIDTTCEQWCKRRQTGARGPSYGFQCPSIHSEANALMFADRREYVGGTIYVTASCCADCTKMIANSGLKRVVMKVREADKHRDPEATVAFLEKCGFTVSVL